MYMFIGWENSAALAEESQDPRVGIGKAILERPSCSWARRTFLALHDRDRVPRGHRALTAASCRSSTPPTASSGCRVPRLHRRLHLDLRHAAVGGQLTGPDHLQLRPRGIAARGVAKVTSSPERRTWHSRVLRARPRHHLHLRVVADPVVYFGEIGTMGTILVALIYLTTNLALPFYPGVTTTDLFTRCVTSCCPCSAVRRGRLPAL